MKASFSETTLHSCLQVNGPRRELAVASLGCLFGTTLLILAIQFYIDANAYLKENEGPKNYFTLNKKIEGGVLINLGKKENVFESNQLKEISKLNGVKRIGGFARNKFPLTLHIWPLGRVGMGAAAKTDLFFESIPDEFLDFIPDEWDWEENASFVPIMVPKFYLDLWNFGLAPSRWEYPTLSAEAATGMPIEIFIGKNRENILEGRFVAFSKRINSVLVPESFLLWANQNFGQPAVRSPISIITQSSESQTQPSRIILEITDNPSSDLLQFIEENGYELNREFPEQDIIKKAILSLFIGMIVCGGSLAVLSIATFATSYRLVVAQSSENTRNLLLLGFSIEVLLKVFFKGFLRHFLFIIAGSLAFGFIIKYFLGQAAAELGIETGLILSAPTIYFTVAYAWVYAVLNKRVIRKSLIQYAS